MSTEVDDEEIEQLPSSLGKFTNKQLLHLFKTNDAFNDFTIRKHKEKIIGYLAKNEVDGQTITSSDRSTFGNKLVGYFNDSKLQRAAWKTYDKFMIWNGLQPETSYLIASKEEKRENKENQSLQNKYLKMLNGMGFDKEYITRAFPIYHANYGYDYNLQILTDVVVRLYDSEINKDTKLQSHKAFPSHLSMEKASKLKQYDYVDHRDKNGLFSYASIEDMQGTNLKIHYYMRSDKYDTWCDFQKEIHRFAEPESISRRPAHRFTHLKQGSHVDINPIYRHPGWRTGEIKKVHSGSGQVQVMYMANDKSYTYWVHLDNPQEIAKSESKSKYGSVNVNDNVYTKSTQLISDDSKHDVTEEKLQMQSPKPKPITDYEKPQNLENYVDFDYGVRFSYWTSYERYPYVAAKYKDIKQELLHNTIRIINIDIYNKLYEKAQKLHQKIHTILGRRDDKNTPYARRSHLWNKYTQIRAKSVISLNHVLSILVHTDLQEEKLPQSLMSVCKQTKPNEEIESVKFRHSEYVNCLRLLFETIILYGNNLSFMDDTVYFGCDKQYYFHQFKAILGIPLWRVTSSQQQALEYQKDSGIVCQLGGLQSRCSWAAPYFDAKSLSKFPNEEQLIFFHAELEIPNIFINKNGAPISPLSLYQSITDGSFLIDKIMLDKKSLKEAQTILNEFLERLDNQQRGQMEWEEYSLTKQYSFNIFSKYVASHSSIYINPTQIAKNIKYKNLRRRFVELDSDKRFKKLSDKLLEKEKKNKLEIRQIKTFAWAPSDDDLKQFITV